MDVRVCGPNLNDQRRGTFHVHRADCTDLRRYGPRRANGGDMNGETEMLVRNASVINVVIAVYPPSEFDYDAGDDASRSPFENDIWFAPCCSDLPDEHIDEPEMISPTYECWVGDDRESFCRLENIDDIADWVKTQASKLPLHGHIHIVMHDESEYTPR